MKIRGVGLKNFRNHKDSHLVLGKKNLVVGDNNSGKSSIKGAIELALTGRSDWTGSRNLRELIYHGKDEAVVEVEVDRLGILEREIRTTGNRVRLNGSVLPDKELEKELQDNFKINYNILGSIISSSEFLNLRPAEQKDFLFNLTGATLTVEKIIEFMEEPSLAAIEKIDEHLTGTVDIDQLDTIYKEFTNERRFKRKVRDDYKSKLELMEIVPSSSGVDIEKVKKAAQAFESGKRILVGERATIKEKENQKKRIMSYIEDADKKINILSKKVDEKIDIAGAEELVFDLITKENSIEKDLEIHRNNVSIRGQNIKTFESMLKKLSTSSCPLSDQLVCNTDKTPLISEFEKEINENKKELEKSLKEGKKLKEQSLSINKEKKHIEDQIKIVTDLDEAKERKAKLEKDLSEIKIESTETIDKGIKKYDEKLEGLSQKIRAHETWVKERKTYEKMLKELAEAEEEFKLYEYLVQEFGPKGVKSRILEKIIKPIEKHCNQTLSVLTDSIYTIHFDFTNGFDLVINHKSGIVKSNLLSSSEKLRIGIVIQDAINSITGAKLLIIDDAEIMDERNRKLLVNLLEKIEANYDTIIIIATMNKEECELLYDELKEDYSVFEVEDGAVYRKED